MRLLDRTCCFFFNDTATTEIYTLSLHDALPICEDRQAECARLTRERDASGWREHLRERAVHPDAGVRVQHAHAVGDRKSTRLNSSHANISYAVFCLKKKKNHIN